MPRGALFQIFWRDCKAAEMCLGIPDKGATDFEGCMQPCVRVKRDGVGPGDATHQRLSFGRYGKQRADATVYMQP
jgi:hypothetical protein